MHKNPTARWETSPGVIFLTSTTSSPYSAEGPHDDRKKWNRKVRQRVGKEKSESIKSHRGFSIRIVKWVYKCALVKTTHKIISSS